MAEQWTPGEDSRGASPPRPFDRQALQATLADAVRTAEEDVTATPSSPEAETTLRPTAGSSATPRPLPLDSVQPGARKVNPFVATPAPAPGSTNGFDAGPGLRAPDPANLGPINFGGGGSQNGLSGVGPSPQTSASDRPTPTIPLRRPRTGIPPRVSPAEAAAEVAKPVEPASAPVAQPARASVPIAAFDPAEDDILPKDAVKRRSFRLR